MVRCKAANSPLVASQSPVVTASPQCYAICPVKWLKGSFKVHRLRQDVKAVNTLPLLNTNWPFGDTLCPAHERLSCCNYRTLA